MTRDFRSSLKPGFPPSVAVSVLGVDMSGNVWEWTRSLWGRAWAEPDFAYPYEPGEELEDLEAVPDVRRVLCGGFFNGLSEHGRCSSRNHNLPGHRSRYSGFRVVVSPFFSGR